MTFQYADIILPLAVRDRYTYRIPEKFSGIVVIGSSVKVQFGRRNTYSGIVAALHDHPPEAGNIRDIKAVIAELPVINPFQLKLWNWIHEYYMCSEGEVLKAATPSEKSIDEYKPRLETYVRLSKKFSENELNDILDKLKKAPLQYKILAEYIALTGYTEGSEINHINKARLISESHATNAVLSSLIKKKILKLETRPVTRLNFSGDQIIPPGDLSEPQLRARESIDSNFESHEVVLLHGVTSSGKTEIYINLITEQLKLGKQVLYMLPEIALTTQIILRLRKHFGEQTGVYHSRLNDPEKFEIWKKVAENDQQKGYRLILGVRSSVFLPFSNLGLVIVDEEHDPSYKQQDPAPRYHGRDCAIMLAHLHGAKTILGSASPSLESYHNSVSGKYGLTELKERYGSIKLPEIIIANTREAHRHKMMVSHFTPELLNAMDRALSRQEQIILFQNRRGFSPYIECPECGWIPTCVQCAVNLTYHKGINKLVCHYCGFTTGLPHSCSNCSSPGLLTRGFGTEKIEDEIRLVFPDARVARMDQDTTRTRYSFNRIIHAFEEKRIDILIGTQMISKGLDFENLTIVGVLNADNMLNYPDFRAHERSFQLMEQVSGRAGRRQTLGRVIIQTSDPSHKIIRNVIRHDYLSMYRLQAEERKTFNYPPFSRMIEISIKHKERQQLNFFAEMLGKELRNIFGKRVLGPESPVINRIQLWYIKTIIIKIEREKPHSKARQLISEAIEKIEKEKGASSLRITVDVDPY